MPTTKDTALNMVRQPIDTLRGYSRRKLRRDLVAGLTVAVVALPQAIAFALIAGVPPQYGLYTAILQGVVGSFFSSSDHLSVGPTNTQSLLIAAAIHRMSGSDDPAVYVQLTIMLTMLKGIIQLAFAFARMGNLVRYVSRSVIVGFTAGAGVLIAIGQLPNFLGVDLARGAATGLPGAMDKIVRIVPQLPHVNWLSVAVGLGALAIVMLARRLSKLAPGPLIAVTGAAAVVWAMGWGDSDLRLVGDLPHGLPTFQWPHFSWSRAEEMLGGAVAIALLGMVESVAIAKSIASKTGQRINANHEFFGQGITNLATSFFQCIPGSGSFSRSALNYTAGAVTRFAGIFGAVFVGLAYLMFGGATKYIPLTSLAAILFVVAWHLIDFSFIRRLFHTNREDLVVCACTFGATLLMPLEYAIYMGVFLNIGLYVRQASRLHMAEMVHTTAGPFVERPIAERGGEASVMFLQLEGDLFFGVADELQERLARLANSPVRVIVLRLKRTLSIDSTVLDVLQQFAMTMKERDKHVVLCGVKEETMRQMESFGLVDAIGRENVFQTEYGVFTSAKHALARARQLVGQSIDTSGLTSEELDDLVGWSYEI